MEGKSSELISYNGKKKEMDCGKGERENGLLYVCLMSWSDKESPHPCPHSRKALGIVSNIKRGTLTSLALLWGGCHELAE